MPAPDDADAVRSALRLGWYLAEVRGRNRPHGPPGAAPDTPVRVQHELPLRIERRADELRIEAQRVVAALARKLGVDDDGKGGSFGERVDELAHQVDHGPAADDSDPAWQALAELLFYFDARIQDTLAATSEMSACAYQLGRGLAETYWALDPAATDGWRGWTFLLGDERCAELSRQLGRLAAYLNEYTAPAIAGSIEIWKDIAATRDWTDRGVAAQRTLYSQVRRWYELVVLGQDPTTLIKPYGVIGDRSVLKKAVELFWPQLLITVGSLVALLLFLVLLSISGTAAWGKTLSGFLALGGLSVAGLTGTLKNAAQAVWKRLRQDAYTDLVAVAVTVVPDAMSPADMAKGIADRRLTPVTRN